MIHTLSRHIYWSQQLGTQVRHAPQLVFNSIQIHPLFNRNNNHDILLLMYRRLGCVGVPLFNVTVQILNPETKTEQPADTDGEICVAGPSVMTGYRWATHTHLTNYLMLVYLFLYPSNIPYIRVYYCLHHYTPLETTLPPTKMSSLSPLLSHTHYYIYLFTPSPLLSLLSPPGTTQRPTRKCSFTKTG